MGEKRTLVPRHLSNRSDLGPSDTDGFEAADSGVDTLSVPRGWNPASLAASDCHLQRRWSPRRVPLRPYLRRLASTGVPTQVKNSLSFFRISSLGQRARHSPFLVVLRTSKPTLALTSPPTPTPCPGRRSPSSTREVENLSKLLRNEHGEDGVLVSQHEFWVDFRARVAQSGSSTGLEALYDLAMAMFNGDDAAVLTGAVVLLPAPDTMAAGTAPYHPLFSPEAASPHASSKRPAPRGSGKAKAPPAKKQRKAPKKAIFTFNLPSSTPAMIKIALANIVQVATSRGLAPFRIAYPWAGQRCWYDPKKYPELHLQHNRSWMRHRAVFFTCALYAPSKNSDERRKQKLLAIAARTCFLSSNVEEFGYYGFLKMVEGGSHDNMMWMGGKAAKHSPGAKEAEGPPPEDLATLLSKDRARYDRVLERALDPTSVDEDGYSSIPELLEQSSLIDPTHPLHLRLSNRALARIKQDLADRPPPVPTWVSNRSRGPWKALLADRTLRPVECEVVRLLLSKKKVAIYNEKKFARSDQADDDSDFEDDDGEYTATGPTPPVQASVSQGGGSDDDELSHSGLAEDSEELGGEGGDVAGKSGQGKSGGRSPGDGGGSVKPRSSKSSGGSASVDKPKDSGKAGDGSSSGDTTASPSADPPSDALEDKPPAPTGGVNLAGTKWTSKSG
ncbi:hypothetical protein PR003_g6621 [Phytophthora rubi]|uniref:Uncharacterized protein n=1 Tax=Phytophthora rubi TaxID=129364 RepID=A0A6A3NUY4_9STRA|nr:hypothetical protein PR001_g3815 [Phytophthora rubi]KAE9348006.1 hypothetical protein PR003_g6621 [Phytophthora rubi]